MLNTNRQSAIFGKLKRIKPNSTVLLVLLIAVLWEVIAFNSSPSRFPSLYDIVLGLYIVFTGTGQFQLLQHVPITLARVAISVIISLLIGIPLGIMMGIKQLSEDFFATYVLLSMTVPAFVWAFLGVLWFGMTTYLVPVMVGVIVLVPYVVFNVWQGTKDINQDLIQMANVFDLSKKSMWNNIYIPHLLPYLFSSARMIIAIGWKIMLVAEVFGAQNGLGFVVSELFLTQQNDLIIAWSIPVMALIFAFERLLLKYEKHKFMWREDMQTQQHAGA